MVLVGPGCMKPNPAFVDTDAGTEGSAGCGVDDAPDSETRAIELGVVASGASPGAAEGTLTADTPAWWFAFATATSSGAGRVVATLQADGDAELCLFVECVDAPAVPTLLCDGGTTARRSPLGRAGCCAADGVGLWHACTSDLEVFVEIAAPDVGACLPFEVEYRVTEPGG